MHRKYLFITVFFSGMTTLALEMSASRLLGNYFGSSNLVWASIIGLIMIYLTVGYFLGGRWADRSPTFKTFYQILAWGAFTVGVIPAVSRPVLIISANAFDQLQLGVLFGSFAAVMILFIIPVTLLGTASPFAIRLSIKNTRESGSLAGLISATSTLGSFIGTFLPVLVLIPVIGTYRTFLAISGVMLIIAITGLWLTVNWRAAVKYSWMPVVIILLALVGMPGTDKAPDGLVYEDESAYNYIQVLEFDEHRFLRLNEGQGVHSVYHPTQLNFYGPWEQVMTGPFFNPAPYNPDEIKNLAIVGLAAGTTARQAIAAFGEDILIDGIEIDPEIVEVAREYFDMNQPNLNVIVQDGRWGLAHSNRKYQIISVDAYRPPYIPWHLTTREFFQEAHEHLTEDGVLVINVGRGPNDRRLINAISSTIGTVFPTIHVIDIPGTFNSIIFATVQPTDASNLADNLAHLKEDPNTSPLLIETMEIALANLQPQPEPSQVFTDDLAPIEWITNSMILDFFISGDVEMIQ